MPKPPDFIDRTYEIEFFEKMLAGETVERILTLLIPPNNGKTYLINYLHGYCQQEQLPVILIDIDYRQSEIISFWKFAYRICDQLGWSHFKNVKACEDQNRDLLPLIQIRTESGHGDIDFGTKGQYREADFDSIAGRDQVHFQTGDINYHEAKGESASRQEKFMHELGRALQDDLQKFCKDNKAVLLLDAYEWISVETRKWVDEWIFSHLIDCYPGLFIVMAGRPERGFPEYVNHPKPWNAFVYIRQNFSQPQEEDVREYINFWKINVVGDEIRAWMKAASYRMSILAQLRDSHRFTNE